MSDVTRTHTAPVSQSEAGLADPWRLRCVASPDPQAVGRDVALVDRIVIGRSGGAALDLAIVDPEMSRAHLELTERGGAVTARDPGSKNGTVVDGVRVAPGGSVQLGRSSVIEVGQTVLVLWHLEDEAWRDTLVRLASSDLAILITGETGVGKEVAAREVHQRSGRRGAFVAVNCGAIPQQLAESTLFGHRRGAFTGATADQAGLFDAAHRGTLMLDEIGELPVALQPQLLRVLEEGTFRPVGSVAEHKVDVRTVSATNRPLRDAMASGAFRPDLYARLAQVEVHIPPLRERRHEILALAAELLGEPVPATPPGVLAAWIRHPWPLNVRGLRNALLRIRAAAAGGPWALSVAELPEVAPAGSADPELAGLLAAHGGNVSEVARALGLDRKQVYRRLQRLGLDPEDFRG